MSVGDVMKHGPETCKACRESKPGGIEHDALFGGVGARGIGVVIHGWQRSNSERMTDWARQGFKTYDALGIKLRMPMRGTGDVG